MTVTFEYDQLTSNNFYLGNIEVDPKRGTITTENEMVSVEPKVISVLIHLAVKSHQVVDQEWLFTQVWPSSVYSPNSLRRCISTLRKILLDDDKTLISTHPKKGYCLNLTPTLGVISDSLNKKGGSLYKKKQWLFVCLAFFLFIYVWNFHFNKQIEFQVKNITPITATESLEDFLAVAPYNKMLVFARQSTNQLSSGTIWLKDLSTNKEIQLNLPPAHRRNLSWTAKGDGIIYAYITKTGWQIRQVKINQISVNESRRYKVEEHILFDNPNSKWISSLHETNNKIYFVALAEQRRHLYELDTNTKNVSKLVTGTAHFEPYELALASSVDKLAVTGVDDANNSIVKTISLSFENKGAQLSSHQIGYQHRFSVEWLIPDKQLLLNNGHRLFTFGFDGAIQKLDYQQSQFIRFAKVAQSSQGKPFIYLVSSSLDNDLSQFDYGSVATKKLINSTAMDYAPSISPNDDHIAFYSTRYGKPQLFVKKLQHNAEHAEEQLLYENPDNYLNVSRAVWSASSDQLAFSVGQNIHTIDLSNSTAKSISISRVDNIFGSVIGWFNQENAIVVLQRQEPISKLIKVNLATLDETLIAEVPNGRLHIAPNDDIFLVRGSAIYRLDDQQQFVELKSFDEKVKGSYATTLGLYIQLGNSMSPSWQFWSYATHTIERKIKLKKPYHVAGFANQESWVLQSTEKRSKDIIKITLK